MHANLSIGLRQQRPKRRAAFSRPPRAVWAQLGLTTGSFTHNRQLAIFASANPLPSPPISSVTLQDLADAALSHCGTSTVRFSSLTTFLAKTAGSTDAPASPPFEGVPIERGSSNHGRDVAAGRCVKELTCFEGCCGADTPDGCCRETCRIDTFVRSLG